MPTPNLFYKFEFSESLYLKESKKELIVEPDIPKWQGEGGVKYATCHLLIEATKDLQNSHEICGFQLLVVDP